MDTRNFGGFTGLLLSSWISSHPLIKYPTYLMRGCEPLEFAFTERNVIAASKLVPASSRHDSASCNLMMLSFLKLNRKVALFLNIWKGFVVEGQIRGSVVGCKLHVLRMLQASLISDACPDMHLFSRKTYRWTCARVVELAYVRFGLRELKANRRPLQTCSPGFNRENLQARTTFASDLHRTAADVVLPFVVGGVPTQLMSAAPPAWTQNEFLLL
ncbi:hypothetical protein EVAR_77568_1 [Eumeta japonica]|uniref:Uncharacterized protein n=1 Tax=Eumeta variegata TaxID=151549 RepID=A0A4C1T6L6_EUMVA|nr:hypothetical protein EVAR_77568_1 [Eumeta japonica]